MALYPEVTQSLAKAPDGPQVGAFFDFDGTLMAGFSALSFTKQQLLDRKLSYRKVMETLGTIADLGRGKIGFSGMMAASAKMMKHIPEEDYLTFGEEVYTKQIAKLIYPEARALVRAHMEKGHTVAIVSSATVYQLAPAARDLGIEHIMSTRFEVEDGKFTGEIMRPVCWQQGKVDCAEEFSKARNIDLDRSYFYSDSHDDIALLERVGHPQPLNPNKKLTAIAERRGWPVRRFHSRGRNGPGDWMRSIAADFAMIPTAAASLPVWALTGSKRRARNFASSLFGDVGTILAGIKLEVNGEHHLWERRPAVFLFNHQSKADVMINAKLLRRDIAGVGKKEVGKYPLMGKIMEFSGTVLIDRSNTRAAVESLQQLKGVIEKEGRSVLIAPEGTRTVSDRLAPFKKGAFHVAMRAGVPVVPIVIHNANDVAPKGDWVYHPATVKVDVLPPVDTTEWTTETLDKHVADVRQMYLEALGQQEDSEAPTAPAKPKPRARRAKKSRRKAPAKKKAPRATKKAATKSNGAGRVKGGSKSIRKGKAGKPAETDEPSA